MDFEHSEVINCIFSVTCAGCKEIHDQEVMTNPIFKYSTSYNLPWNSIQSLLWYFIVPFILYDWSRELTLYTLVYG